nr:MAG TPA_asm: putative chloroplast protein Ycf34 [Caudoviricetes sp.]
MNRNECINCKYYDKCGKPSRPIKCMGYEPKEAAVETERHKTDETQKV